MVYIPHSLNTVSISGPYTKSAAFSTPSLLILIKFVGLYTFLRRIIIRTHLNINPIIRMTHRIQRRNFPTFATISCAHSPNPENHLSGFNQDTHPVNYLPTAAKVRLCFLLNSHFSCSILSILCSITSFRVIRAIGDICAAFHPILSCEGYTVPTCYSRDIVQNHSVLHKLFLVILQLPNRIPEGLIVELSDIVDQISQHLDLPII